VTRPDACERAGLAVEPTKEERRAWLSPVSIPAHGGALVNLLVPAARARELKAPPDWAVVGPHTPSTL